MSAETENYISRSLHIGRGIEINIGQTVPVLEHPNCSGLWGRIIAIDTEIRTYNAQCNTCGNSVFIDVKSLNT